MSSIRNAAIEIGLSKSTLDRYAIKYKMHDILPPIRIKNEQNNMLLFASKLEAKFAECLKESANLNHGLTIVETRKIGLHLCPKNWLESEKVSKDWLINFMNRNPFFSNRKPLM
jgi:hypothetical protein